jgi:hypoxanthine phosphoribosyltransferase
MIPHRVFIDERAIGARVKELARAIAHDLEGRQPILLGLLCGGFVFLADLARELSRLGVEPRVDFLSVSHYGTGTDPTRRVVIQKGTELKISGQAVLVVDDILDTGQSLQVVVEHLIQQKPVWLRTCVFLDKPSRHTVPIKMDYVGFEVPDRWFIGYGLDLGGEGRALPYVGEVERENDGP